MGEVRKTLTLILVALLILVLVLVGTGALPLPLSAFSGLIARISAELTGLRIDIGGPLTLHLGPRPRLEASDITVVTAQADTRPLPVVESGPGVDLRDFGDTSLNAAVLVDSRQVAFGLPHRQRCGRGAG